MVKDEKIILTEAMVYGATALGVHIVKEIAVASLVKQPSMTLAQFINVLDNYEAQVKASQTVKTTIVDADEPSSTPPVINL